MRATQYSTLSEPPFWPRARREREKEREGTSRDTLSTRRAAAKMSRDAPAADQCRPTDASLAANPRRGMPLDARASARTHARSAFACVCARENARASEKARYRGVYRNTSEREREGEGQGAVAVGRSGGPMASLDSDSRTISLASLFCSWRGEREIVAHVQKRYGDASGSRWQSCLPLLSCSGFEWILTFDEFLLYFFEYTFIMEFHL